MKKTTEASITITNKSELAVKSVTLFLTGQTKTGITLQSGSTHTLKKKTASEKILPQETKTIVISRAFNNPQLYTLMLKEITVEYENGSLEILK